MLPSDSSLRLIVRVVCTLLCDAKAILALTPRHMLLLGLDFHVQELLILFLCWVRCNERLWVLFRLVGAIIRELLLVNVLYSHGKHKIVRRSCCWARRNQVLINRAHSGAIGHTIRDVHAIGVWLALFMIPIERHLRGLFALSLTRHLLYRVRSCRLRQSLSQLWSIVVSLLLVFHGHCWRSILFSCFIVSVE